MGHVHRAQCPAVLLRVPNDADAYKMFETLNDRGLRTSQADLIKNYLFGHAATRINEIQTRWAYMRGALESLEEDEVTTVTFLRHALIVLRGFLREAEVYDIVQDLVNSASSAIEFSSTLEGLSHAYVASFNPEHERWSSYSDSARRAIEVFNLLKIRPMQPLLLAITAKMNGIEASASFQFALSLGVRLLIASTTRSGSVEGPLADAANAVYLGTIQSVGGLRERLHTITPSDQEFREAFEVARVSNARLARYLLRSLEMTASGGAEPWFIPLNDRSVITLEHVLPRKPGTAWPGFTDDDVRRYSPRLGNLALLQAKANSNLRSDAFSERTGVYASSPYILTNRIGRQPQWTPEAIVERQRWMADLAVRTWPVTG